ncbi:hypothetical protein Patl1_36636 [Pistacia atlantica]|nr:hypothetical protein Patl1_36636 [Pistacia atlantica]
MIHGIFFLCVDANGSLDYSALSLFRILTSMGGTESWWVSVFLAKFLALLDLYRNWSLPSLNSNNFSGEIPPSIGRLSKLYWLDLANSQLTGPIPVSDLDMLVQTKHLYAKCLKSF